MGENSLCTSKFISAIWNIRTCLPCAPYLPQIINRKTEVFSWKWNHFIYLSFNAKISLFYFNGLNTLILLSQVIQHFFFHLWDYNSHINFLTRNACLIFSLFFFLISCQAEVHWEPHLPTPQKQTAQIPYSFRRSQLTRSAVLGTIFTCATQRSLWSLDAHTLSPCHPPRHVNRHFVFVLIVEGRNG